MAQDKKISKDQAIRYEYVRGLVLAGEVIVVFPPLAEPLISCRTRQATHPSVIATERPEPTHVTYPRFNVSVRPEPSQERIRLNTGGSVVAPVLYSLEFRQAWKKITNRS